MSSANSQRDDQPILLVCGRERRRPRCSPHACGGRGPAAPFDETSRGWSCASEIKTVDEDFGRRFAYAEEGTHPACWVLKGRPDTSCMHAHQSRTRRHGVRRVWFDIMFHRSPLLIMPRSDHGRPAACLPANNDTVGVVQ